MRGSAAACGSARRTPAAERQRRGGMSARLIVLASLLTLLPGVAPAQPTVEPTENGRLPWGDPDLQGIWLYQTYTPLERPEAFADKAVF